VHDNVQKHNNNKKIREKYILKLIISKIKILITFQSKYYVHITGSNYRILKHSMLYFTNSIKNFNTKLSFYEQ